MELFSFVLLLLFFQGVVPLNLSIILVLGCMSLLYVVYVWIVCVNIELGESEAERTKKEAHQEKKNNKENRETKTSLIHNPTTSPLHTRIDKNYLQI